MEDAKAAMKARMAEVKAKQAQKVAQIKALKAAKATPPSVPTSAEIRPKEQRPSTGPPKTAPAPQLPSGFFDNRTSESKGVASEQAPVEDDPPAQSRAAIPTNSAPQPSVPTTTSTTNSAAPALLLAYGSSGEDEEDEEEDEAEPVPAVAQPAAAAKATVAEALPDGFFDDKTKDALAHNKAPPKAAGDIEEEFAEFQELIEDDLENLDKAQDEEAKLLVEGRDKDDKEEQEFLQAKVSELREARKSLLGRRAEEAAGPQSKRGRFLDPEEEEEEDDDEEDDEDDDDLDWRRKKF